MNIEIFSCNTFSRVSNLYGMQCGVGGEIYTYFMILK